MLHKNNFYAWAANNFPPHNILFYLLYHNITSLISPKIILQYSAFVYYLVFVNGILFLPSEIVARPKPD